MACSQCENLEKKRFYQKHNYIVASLILGAVSLGVSIFWDKIIGDVIWLDYLNPAWIAIVMCGIPLFIAAFENLFKGKVKSALLISVAMVACVILQVLCWLGITQSGHENNLLAAGEIAFLMMIGEFLEDVTVGKSRKGIEALYSLAPDTAEIQMEGEFYEFPVSFVKVGDVVRVKPFCKIPVDGEIISGKTSVNQSAITGESVPVDKDVCDEVFAGTFNENSSLLIKVTRPNEQTVVSKMIALVKDAENKKAPIARIADKWAARIVPLAMILAVAVFFFSKLLPDMTWLDSLVRGITILVVFCPCSLALATPTAISAGIGNASYNGILVKSGEALEKLSTVDTVVFDKTGTLTLSDVTVCDYSTKIDEAEFFSLLGSAEQESEHPIARAIVDFCKSKSTLTKAEDVRSEVGVGVSANVDGKKVFAAKFASFDGVEFSEEASVWESDGKTVIGVSCDGALVGAVALSDKIRDGSASAVQKLNAMGVKTVMLTGDNQSTAQAVAKTCGVSEVRASLLPEQKVEAIETLKQQGKVLMVGDGVNDAPALATADCSLAMGKIGSDASLEVADMVLFNDKIEKAPFMVKLSRKVLSAIKRNIIISMSINVIAVVLSFFGWLTPVWGAVVHNCSSVFVVASSAMLLLVKEKSIDKK